MPAVVTVKEGINLPRYPSVPGRLRAKRKPLDRQRARRGRTAARDGPPRTAADGRASRLRCSAPAPRPRRRWSGCCRRSGSSDDYWRCRGSGRRALPAGARVRARARRTGERSRDRRRWSYAPAAWAQAIVELIAQRSPSARRRAGHATAATRCSRTSAAKLDQPMAANCVSVMPGFARDRDPRAGGAAACSRRPVCTARRCC